MDAPAAFHCDFCLDDYCIKCFWKCHFNGFRRHHTVTKTSINPLCNQCHKTRASVFCEQCQELLCTDCFSYLHYKGNRQLHLFMDAMNLLLLLERLDPGMQEHMRRARPRVLWAITQLQGWTRGIEARRFFRMRRDLIVKIQRRWRGSLTRKKLLSMIDHYKWRRKQINNFFLPRARNERVVMKQKFQSQLAQKQVTYTSAKHTLKELRNTILQSASANPMEDLSRTSQMMSRAIEPAHDQAASAPIALPVFKQYEDSRFAASLPAEMPAGSALSDAPGNRQGELTTKDMRKATNLSLRQLLTIDERPEGAPLPPENREADQTEQHKQLQFYQRQREAAGVPPEASVRVRGGTSYRD